MRLQEMMRWHGRHAFGTVLALLILAPGARAEEYLCTTKPYGRGDAVAPSILLDIRHGLYAMVYDKLIEDALGAPVMAEVTVATPALYRLNWTVPNVEVQASSAFGGGGEGLRRVYYFATLERKTMVFRVRAKAVSADNMGAAGKCVLKK